MDALVSYQGGLGNQLFQWAFAHIVAKTHNISQDYSWFQTNKDRRVEINDLVSQCDHLNEMNENKTYFKKIHNSNLEVLRKINRTTIVDDRNFLSRDWEQKQKLIVSGYFQSERIIGKVEHEIGPELQKFLNKNVNIGLDFNLENVVALHVRRGDYLNADVKKNIGALDDEYFLKQLRDESGTFLILTENRDDVVELTSRIVEISNLLICDSQLLGGWETLKVMTECRKFIGSNSSLSWWGAFLRENNSKASSLPAQWTKGGLYSHPGKELMSKCSYLPPIWKA